MALQTKTFSEGSFAYQSASRSYVIDLILAEESTSVENNTSTVSYRLQLRSGGNNRFSDWPVDYSITLNGSVVSSGRPLVTLPYNSTKTLATGTAEIPHESDGSKKLSVKAEIHVTDDRPFLPPRISIDDVWSLTDIPRASTIVCTDGYIESYGSLTIQSYSSSFVHTLLCSFGNVSYWVGANGEYHEGPDYISGGTIPFHFTDTFYAQMPNSKAKEGTIRCDTYLASNTSQLIGRTYATFTAMTMESRCSPKMAIDVRDVNDKTISLTGNSNLLVKFYSTALCTANVTPKNSASVSVIQCNGHSLINGPVEIPNVETNGFNFTAIDSRGYQVWDSEYLYYIDYVRLTNNAVAKREGQTTDRVSITFSGDYFNGGFGSAQNTLEILYKLSTDNTYNKVDAILDGNTYSATAQLTGLSYQHSYTIETIVRDKLSEKVKNLTIYRGTPVFNWGKDYFNVNVPFKLAGTAANDFVIAEGLSSGWYYRKWNNGDAECWKSVEFSMVINEAWGAIYSSKKGAIRQERYPFDFIQPPSVFHSAQNNNFMVASVEATSQTNSDLTKYTPTLKVWGASDFKDWGSLNIRYYAVGKWK